ncbi:MAG: GntR family transcriptional regulator [Pseudomonadota bacterium]
MNRFEHENTGNDLIGATKSARIANVLEVEIRSGTISKGDALASESALVKRFSVSRNTVRKSLEILSDKGLITTKSGLGSFVTYGGQMIDDRRGWSVALSESADSLGTRVLRIERAHMDFEDAPADAKTDCLFVDRLRFHAATGVAVSLERSRVIWRSGFENILSDGLKNGSLTDTLRSKGLVVASGDEWANVLPSLSADDAQILGRRAGEPMLLLRRLTRAADGMSIEYIKSLLDPHRFGLHMRF